MHNTEHLLENPEKEIIQKIVAGETALFEILIRKYNPVLYKIARSYGFRHHDAEDLMQDAHVSAYTHLASFAFRASYKTWISKIMIHKCLYKLGQAATKNEKTETDSIHENAVPVFTSKQSRMEETNLLRKEFARVLEDSLQKIPLAYRTVFIFREVEGFSVAETAELLRITPINVKVRLSRARTMLQKQLEQFYTAADIYEFHLSYCDKMVQRVLGKIKAMS